MCQLFFSTEPPDTQRRYMYNFFDHAVNAVEPPDKFVGLGTIMKRWSNRKNKAVWSRRRHLSATVDQRVKDDIADEIERARPSAFGAQFRMLIHDSPDRFPYEPKYFNNTKALQPILFKGDYAMLYKGYVAGFPTPDVQQKMRARISLHTHNMFTAELNLLSDVSYLFFLIIAFIYEDYVANTPPAAVRENERRNIKVAPSEERAMRGIANAVAWFKEAGIEFVAHIVLLTPHFAVAAVHNAPAWFVNKGPAVTTFSTNAFYDGAQRREGDALFVIPFTQHYGMSRTS
jgi:hypothetical protein